MTPPPTPQTPGPTTPRLSVILPLIDDRGMIGTSIETLTQQQTAADDAFEIIAVAPPGQSAAMPAMRARLRAHDRLIEGPDWPVYELCSAGAAVAKGTWLFFTEGHCAWDAGLVQALITYLDASDFDAADTASTDVTPSAIGALEQTLMAGRIAGRAKRGDWRRVIARGFAIRRSTYTAVGGYQGQYGFFAEALLSRDLHLAGVRIGHAKEAVVRHCGTEGERATDVNVRLWVAGESRYRTQHGGGDVYEFFGAPGSWCTRGERTRWARRAAAGAVAAVARGKDFRTRLGGWRTRLRLGGSRQLRRWAGALRADLRVRRARLGCTLGRPASRQQAFGELWERCADRAWRDAGYADLANPVPRDASGGHLDVSGRDLLGFYAPQRDAARWVRRITNLAVVRLPIFPGPCEVEVRFDEAPATRPVLVFDGAVVADAKWIGTRVRFTAPARAPTSGGVSGPATLVLVDPDRLGRRAREHPDATRHRAVIDITLAPVGAPVLRLVLSPAVPVRATRPVEAAPAVAASAPVAYRST